MVCGEQLSTQVGTLQGYEIERHGGEALGLKEAVKQRLKETIF